MTSPAASRRPCSVEESAACFVVRNHNGQALAMCISRMSRAGSGTDTDACRGDGRTVVARWTVDHCRVAMLRLAFFRGRGLP